METLKQIALYTGGITVAVIAFHIFILAWMILGILVAPEQVAHTPYWDGLLKTVIEFFN